MKKQILTLLCGTFLIWLGLGMSGCSTIESGMMKAAIHASCNDTINFQSKSMYAYRADAFFFMPSIQAGAERSNTDEELGVNFFAASEAQLMIARNYPLNSGSGEAGTAYVFYQAPGSSMAEYISKENSGTLSVELIEMNGSGEPRALVYSISEVEVERFSDGSQLCLRDVRYEGS